MTKRFHICTIINRPEQYASMRRSFAAAQFSEELCRYSCFDNSTGNWHDPYRTLDGLIAETAEEYIILCHQDVQPNLGHTAIDLLATLKALSQTDPNWVVAGNAGVDGHGNLVLHLDDPHGRFRAAHLPRPIVSLDENFLIIRSRCGISLSPALSGFHLYATDLVLNARLRRHGAYVINFLLTHLSRGNPTSREFSEARSHFKQVWRPRLLVGLIQTTTGAGLYISRFPIVEKLIRRSRVRRWFWRFGLSFVPAKTGAKS